MVSVEVVYLHRCLRGVLIDLLVLLCSSEYLTVKMRLEEMMKMKMIPTSRPRLSSKVA